MPFGTGQRTCIGMNLANAEMAAVLSELGRTYTLQVTCNVVLCPDVNKLLNAQSRLSSRA